MPRFARNSTSPVGGTTLTPSNTPKIALVAAALLAVLVIGYFVVRGGKKNAIVEVEPNPSETRENVVPTQSNGGGNVTSSPTLQSQNKAPTPEPLAADLERSLKRARLWATVTVIGGHVIEVRSGSCSDPQMKPTLDAVAGSFKAAGITQMRCLEQSGSVVFDRDL